MKKELNFFLCHLRKLLENLADEYDNPKLRGLVRMYNVIGVSLSLGLDPNAF